MSEFASPRDEKQTTLWQKKPLVVQAWRVSDDLGSAPEWVFNNLGIRIHTNGGFTPFFINTLEGRLRANLGDWIVRGVAGELYPVRDDIFQQTYEPASRGEANAPAVAASKQRVP